MKELVEYLYQRKFNVKTIAYSQPPFNRGLDSSPVTYSERVRFRALPFPARHLARRYGLMPSTALQVAELIGYAVGGDR